MSNEAQSLVRKLGGSGDFSSSQVMILLLLADHADEKWECWPSLALLCHHSQFSERTVRSSIRALREKGVLTVREQRSQATGARLENRYRLNKAVIEPFALRGDQRWEQTKTRRAGRSAAVRSQVLPVSEEPDGFIADGPAYGVLVAAGPYPATVAGYLDPHDCAPATTAGHQPATAAGYPNPRDSAPAPVAGYRDARQITTGCPANNDQKPVVPLKGTRADLTINHQSSISTVPDPVPAASTSGDETMMDDDDHNPGSSGKAEIHRGVNLAQLFALMPEPLRMLDALQARRLIDLVLARAGTISVKSPLRYVAKACQQDPEGLAWLITAPEAQPTAGFLTPPETSPTRAVPADPMVAECDEHLWAHPNPQAICPGCRADALSAPEPDQERPPMPQPGDFRTDLRLRLSVGDCAGESVGELPWGSDDEPGF
ncbi:helix-turn-helix domain-containing protein [Glutamicibacter uratoxydans]|uniref:helix-turn-helix domain-containing protein n=1 Tax=Glutamicibacter uratoxydans TaxID=43667 RepID=UPI003D6DC058